MPVHRKLFLGADRMYEFSWLILTICLVELPSIVTSILEQTLV